MIDWFHGRRVNTFTLNDLRDSLEVRQIKIFRRYARKSEMTSSARWVVELQGMAGLVLARLLIACL
jgi:hypothetical protein